MYEWQLFGELVSPFLIDEPCVKGTVLLDGTVKFIGWLLVAARVTASSLRSYIGWAFCCLNARIYTHAVVIIIRSN